MKKRQHQINMFNTNKQTCTHTYIHMYLGIVLQEMQISKGNNVAVIKAVKTRANSNNIT